MNTTRRLEGLDLARCFAFFGMVAVNFSLAMGADPLRDPGFLASFEQALQGRAAATFVVLAGLGLGLAAQRAGEEEQTFAVTLRRAAFLLVAGILNTLIFPADILHYYAVYFVLGALCLRLPSGFLISLVAIVALVPLPLITHFDYNAGWNWQTFDYRDFWTLSGFVRNLGFNGFHPVFPWLALFLFGMALARLNLHERKVQNVLAFSGLAGLALATGLSAALSNFYPALAGLLTTSPIPPMPLFVLAGLSGASVVIGVCLRAAENERIRAVLAPLFQAGRQTLTLYIAHILLGMGTLEALGLLGGQSYGAVAIAVLVFCALAVVYSVAWSRVAKRGPAEMMMRKIAG